MKTKLIGLGILAAVIIAAAAYVFISNSQTVTEINGYVGKKDFRLGHDESPPIKSEIGLMYYHHLTTLRQQSTQKTKKLFLLFVDIFPDRALSPTSG